MFVLPLCGCSAIDTEREEHIYSGYTEGYYCDLACFCHMEGVPYSTEKKERIMKYYEIKTGYDHDS